MERIIQILFCLLTIILMIYFFLPNRPYISNSKIHGHGLFAGKNYKKGDIIFEDLFPYKEKDKIIFNPIEKKKFQDYILEEGKYINHCSINNNIDIKTTNYRVFPVIAIQDIQKHDELFVDYNLLHKYYPFIAPALPNYVKC